MGRHRLQDRRPPGDGDRPAGRRRADAGPGSAAELGAGPGPAEDLGVVLRGWTTLVEGGPRGPRLVLHRSVVSRATALVALALVAALLSYTGLEALADPLDRDARVSFALCAVLLGPPLRCG